MSQREARVLLAVSGLTKSELEDVLRSPEFKQAQASYSFEQSERLVPQIPDISNLDPDTLYVWLRVGNEALKIVDWVIAQVKSRKGKAKKLSPK